MPAHYRSVEEEHRAVRERVGMMDTSLMGRIDVNGRDALEYLQRLAANDASKLSDSQSMYTTLCNERGGIMDDLTVWRISEDHFRIVTSSIMRYKTLKWLQDHVEDRDIYLTDISPSLGMISVQGPRSRELLQELYDGNVSALKFFHFSTGKLGGVSALIARVGFSGESGLRVLLRCRRHRRCLERYLRGRKKVWSAPVRLRRAGLAAVRKGLHLLRVRSDLRE